MINQISGYSFPVNHSHRLMNEYTISIQFKDKSGFSFEVQAKGIRLSIELACKEMKEAYPYFIEGIDFTIVEIKLNK